MIKIGSTNIKTVMLGTQPIKAVYKGASLIWQKITKVLKSVSGGTSATLTDCYDDRSLVLWEGQGKDGGSGDKTSNLFPEDYNSLAKLGGYYGLTTLDQTQGKSYSVQIIPKTSGATIPSGLYFGLIHHANATATGWSAIWMLQNGALRYYCQAMTLDDAHLDLNICFYPNNKTLIDEFFANWNVMVVEGSYTSATMPTYQPYGYQIGVLGQSSIFDYEFYFANKQTVTGSTNDRYEYQLKPNTTYYVSSNIPYQNGVTIVFAKSGQYTNTNTPTTANAGFGINDGTVVDRTVTTDANGYMYIAIRNQTGTYAILNGLLDKFRNGTYYIILRESYKTPICLPMYLGSNQLNSLNGHTDKAIIDFEHKTSKNVRQNKTITFNGTESWTTTGDTSAGVYQGFAVANATFDVAKPTSGRYQTICEEFPYSYSSVANSSRVDGGNYGLRLIIGADRVPSLTKADFITWLKANPITITYPCATEYEESTTELNTTTLNATQTTFEGTTVVVDGSTNKVASMDVEYYASK